MHTNVNVHLDKDAEVRSLRLSAGGNSITITSRGQSLSLFGFSDMSAARLADAFRAAIKEQK